MNKISAMLANGANRLAAWMGGTSGYRGATVSRMTDDWYPANLSADQILKADLRLLRGRARQMERDNPNAAGYIQALKDNVIGTEWGGIRLQARTKTADVRTLTGFTPALNTKLNEHLEAQWGVWGYPETCSADGRDSWGDLQRLYVGRLAIDGEVLYRFLPGFDNPFGLAIEFLDADQLDESVNRPATDRENEIRMGVEIDAHNRPIAYWIWRHHPADFTKPRERIRVPAADLCHDFIKTRPGQTRGIPWFTPVIFGWRMLDGYTQAEITQARISASRGGFFEAVGSDAEFWESALRLGPNDKKEPLVMDLEPGLARQLPPGLHYNDQTPAHPNGNYGDFEKTINRQLATGLGVSYFTFTGDFENTNYSSGRMGLLPERDFYRGIARWVTLRFHRRAYTLWLRQSALKGALQIGNADVARISEHVWQYRGWPWVDPLNDAQADTIRLKQGRTSWSRLAAEDGLDFEEMMQEQAADKAIAEKYGIDLSTGDDPIQPRHDAPPPTNGNGQKPTNGNGGSTSRIDLVPLGAS